MVFNKIVVQGIELIPWLGGFTQTLEGDEVTFTGSAMVQVLATPKRYSCEVTVNDGRQSIYQQLLALMRSQYVAVNGIVQGLEVEDYINPDDGVLTIRRMFITDLKQVGGSIRINGQNLTKGTTVKLTEIQRRY